MAKFMAVHTMPMTKEQALAMLNDPKNQLPAGFVWKQSWCDFASQKFFCDWEAPSKEALEQIFKSMKMPYEAVYPVELLDVPSKSFK